VLLPDLDAAICSGENTGITLGTNPASAGAASYDIAGIVAGAGLAPSAVNTLPGAGQPAGAIFNDQFTNTSNSPENVTYTVIPVSAAGCAGDMEIIQLTVAPVPVVNSTVTDESICNGENVDFTLMTNTSPAGNVHFDYSVSASAAVSGFMTPVAGLTNGVRVVNTLLSTSLMPEPVIYTVTPYFNACAGLPIDITYTVNPSPSAAISGGGQICQGDTAWLTFNMIGAPPFTLTYETNYGVMTTINNIAGNTHTIGVSPMADTNYRIISVFDGNGSTCNGALTGQADVLVQETPVASFNADNLEGCAPLIVNFDNFSTGNLQGPATGYYYRIVGDPNLVKFSDDLYTTFEFQNTTSAPVVYEVVFIAESSQGCTDMLAREIRVNPAVQLDVTANDPLEGCNEHMVTFSNNHILPGIMYVWEWGDGEANDTTFTETSVSHTFYNLSTVAAKTFNVHVKALDPLTGCEETAVFPVRISPSIFLDLEANVDEGCSPLAVNAINRSGGVQQHTWYYRVKGSNERTEEVHTSSVTYMLRNTTTEVQTYQLIYTGRNIYNCEESDTLEVVVWPELNAGFIASPERQVLPNSVVSIQNLTNVGPWNYSWVFGDGNDSTDPALQEYDYDTYGIYQIILEVSVGPCVDQSSQTVTIEPITPIVDFDAVPREGCSPLTVDFINKSKYADPSTYFWEFGDNVGFSNAENPSFTFYEPGVYSVSLEASNELGIVVRQEYEMFITVYQTPIAQFRVRPSTVYVPDQPVYTSNLSYGATQYFWDFGDAEGIDDTSTEEEPYYYYTNPGVYDVYLWVGNEEGCVDSVLIYKAVIAEPGGELATPNVFTPNPDGPNGGEPGNVAFNDVFLPFEKGAVEFHMQIFNRWGELLFESYDKNIGWDGYYKGRLAKSDVYIYKLDLQMNDGRRLTKLGDVFLLR
jgi:gliding motility-associated-like protein